MPPFATWSISHASPGSSRLNLAIAAAVFPVIFLGELPDKTMIASLALAPKARPGAVWLGAAAIHDAIQGATEWLRPRGVAGSSRAGRSGRALSEPPSPELESSQVRLGAGIPVAEHHQAAIGRR